MNTKNQKAAFHFPIVGQSVGMNNSVVLFLRGARRPHRPYMQFAHWVEGPEGPSLWAATVYLWSLSLKSALLIALALVKRVGDLQALSISPACLKFGPNNSKVILKPKHGYVPKVLSTPFRAQVIMLSALPPSEEDRELSLLCPVRALMIYFEHSASFRRTEQIFVSLGNCAKGHPVMKQRLSKWMLLCWRTLPWACNAPLEYEPIPPEASWSGGVSITEIYAAAGWAWPSTFARIYNLEVLTLKTRVLSA